MKAAVFERHQGSDIVELCQEALKKYPTCSKLWMILGQFYKENKNDPINAQKTFTEAVKKCPECVPLWIQASSLEEEQGRLTVARSLLEKARTHNPKTPALWLEAIRLESRSENESLAKFLMARALQECPLSGILLAESIFMEPRQKRKSVSADAFKKTDNDAHVINAIAR